MKLETRDGLLIEGEKYFEKVMPDFNHNLKGLNLRKYCFHHITRKQAMFLLSNAVQSEIYIYDNDKDDQRAVGGL